MNALTDTSLPALAQAVEMSRSEMLRNYGRSPLAEMVDGPGYLRVYTGIPAPFFNGVLRAHLAPEQVDGLIAEAQAYFSQRGCTWCWVVGPASEPAGLEERLLAGGLEGGHEGIGMGADLEAIAGPRPVPPGLEIVQVRDERVQAAFVEVYVTGFGMADGVRGAMRRVECSLSWAPELSYHRFLGLLDGKPVATTALLLGERVAGVYHVTTVPEARKQGIGRAMTRRAMVEARASGYRIAVLHASKGGARVYSTLGFQECTLLREYVAR